MTWDAYHRRRELLREILVSADRSPELTLTALLWSVDPHCSVFKNETAALFEIQMAWFQRLSGHIDRLTTDGGETPEMVVIAAWAAAATQMPGACAILDAHQDRPELAKAFAKERTFLAASVGVPAQHPDLGVIGDRIVSAARLACARDDNTRQARELPGDDQRQGLIARLRSVIAA